MAKVKEEKKGFHEQIIESAGQIYNYLSNKGEVSINKMKKDLSLGDNFAEMGLGWLSREDKLEYTQKAKSVTVKLR
ncbi:MAG: winged helix-turn-helix domain-containing protein [bacterium]|nr:winged helix-turn-helix domain-containing protein [bacterium]